MEVANYLEQYASVYGRSGISAERLRLFGLARLQFRAGRYLSIRAAQLSLAGQFSRELLSLRAARSTTQSDRNGLVVDDPGAPVGIRGAYPLDNDGRDQSGAGSSSATAIDHDNHVMLDPVREANQHRFELIDPEGPIFANPSGPVYDEFLRRRQARAERFRLREENLRARRRFYDQASGLLEPDLQELVAQQRQLLRRADEALRTQSVVTPEYSDLERARDELRARLQVLNQMIEQHRIRRLAEQLSDFEQESDRLTVGGPDGTIGPAYIVENLSFNAMAQRGLAAGTGSTFGGVAMTAAFLRGGDVADIIRFGELAGLAGNFVAPRGVGLHRQTGRVLNSRDTNQGLQSNATDVAISGMNIGRLGINNAQRGLAGPRQRTNDPVLDSVDSAFREEGPFEVGALRQTGRSSQSGRSRDFPPFRTLGLTSQQLRNVRRLMGRRLTGAFRRVWQEANNARSRTEMAEVRRLWRLGTPDSQRLGRELAREVFNRWRGRFWTRIRNNPRLLHRFEEAGFIFSGGATTAPYVRFSDHFRESVTLEHISRLTDDPTRAVDAGNLLFSPSDENSVNLEAIRRMDPFQDPPSAHGVESSPQ